MSDITKAAEQIVIEKLNDLSDKIKNAANIADITAVKAEFAEFKATQEADSVKLADIQKLVNDLNEKAGRIQATETKGRVTSLRSTLQNSFDGLGDNLKALSQQGNKDHINLKLETGAIREFSTKEVGDMTVANNLVGSSGVPSYMPGIVAAPFEPTHFRQIFGVTPSATDLYHFIRHDETIGEGSVYWQSAPGAAKNQRDYDLTDVTVNLTTLAGYVKVVRQMLRNVPGLAAYLGQYLPEDYYQAEDARGYQALLDGAYTTGSTAGGWDGIIATLGTLGNAKYNGNVIITRPSSVASLIQNKDTYNSYTYPGAINIAANGQLTVMGVPVVSATWVGTDKAVIAAREHVKIVQSEGLSLRSTEYDQDDFIKNRITWLIEATIGFALYRPKAYSIIDLGYE